MAFMTLNILRHSCLNTNVSSCTHLFGKFDFNYALLAPPGRKEAMHSKPSESDTWGPNGKIGYYVGPAINHY